MFLADKTFLITAIHHSIVNMEKLNAELINRGDTSFQGVLDSIATAEERKQIRIWRTMNEHDLDYLSNNGNYQKEFITTVKKGDYTFETNAFVTLIHGDAKIFLIGSIEIDKLLVRFKENMAQIQKKSKEVFERYSCQRNADMFNRLTDGLAIFVYIIYCNEIEVFPLSVDFCNCTDWIFYDWAETIRSEKSFNFLTVKALDYQHVKIM